jgi:hypothetical protein
MGASQTIHIKPNCIQDLGRIAVQRRPTIGEIIDSNPFRSMKPATHRKQTQIPSGQGILKSEVNEKRRTSATARNLEVDHDKPPLQRQNKSPFRRRSPTLTNECGKDGLEQPVKAPGIRAQSTLGSPGHGIRKGFDLGSFCGTSTGTVTGTGIGGGCFTCVTVYW